MFIGITGPRLVGKHTVAKWLISKHKFTLVSLRDGSYVVKDEDGIFETPKKLLEYVTKNWRRNFVTCNVETKEILELYRKRPFFFLIAMDGPVLTRYKRYRLL
ncbi:9174_t:CDS:2, partial [Acaulospora morrowiae]